MQRPPKILIFSDTHLTHRFSKPQFDLLKKLITIADQVIINGDFWDVYGTTWEQFLSSKWSGLFALLKKKKAVYIFGNHDQKHNSDHRAALFSDIQTLRHIFTAGSTTYQVEHGHVIAPSPELLNPWMQNKWLLTIGRRLEDIGTRILGHQFLVFINGRRNKIMKKYQQKYLKDKILICGHSHVTENSPHLGYINDGLIGDGMAQYVWIEGDRLTLIDERY